MYEMATLEKLFPFDIGTDFTVKKNILTFETENLTRNEKFNASDPLIKMLIKK